MSEVDVYAALADALDGVRGVRLYRDISAAVAPPAVVLGPPELTWEGYGQEPREATFTVALVVAQNDRAIPTLLDLRPAVTAAVSAVPDVIVRRAAPGTWPAGDLPAYLIEIEASL